MVKFFESHAVLIIIAMLSIFYCAQTFHDNYNSYSCHSICLNIDDCVLVNNSPGASNIIMTNTFNY